MTLKAIEVIQEYFFKGAFDVIEALPTKIIAQKYKDQIRDLQHIQNVAQGPSCQRRLGRLCHFGQAILKFCLVQV